MGTTTVFLNDDGQYEQSVDYGDDYKDDTESGVRSENNCPHCGGYMIGDGYTTIRHCENADLPLDVEPDVDVIYCKEEGDPLTEV
jgi:hypothetical protein